MEEPSKEVPELVNDDKILSPSSFKTPPHGGFEDNEDEELTPKVDRNNEITEEGEEGEKLAEGDPDSPPATNAEEESLRNKLNLSALTLFHKSIRQFLEFNHISRTAKEI